MSSFSKLAASVAKRFDSWASASTGLGSFLRDKSTTFNPYLRSAVADKDLETLLDFDDMASILAEAEPEAMFRQGFEARTGDPIIDEAIKRDVIERLEVCRTWTDALVYEAVYGGAAIVIGVNDGLAATEPVNEAGIASIDYLLAIDRRDVRPIEWDEDVLSPRFGKPTLYEILPTHRSAGMGGVSGDKVYVHYSRMIVFEGLRCSPTMKRQRQGWGQSKLDRSFRALQIFHGNWASIANLLTDASQAVFKIPQLWDIMTSPERANLETRAEVMDMSRSVARAIMLDKDEEYERSDTSMSGLPEMLDRTSHRLAASARMPVAILMGREPSGLNATGESDIRSWYDNVAAKRATRVEPQLRKLFRYVFLAKNGPTRGVEPATCAFKWPPMWQMSPVEKSQVYATNTQADVALVQAQVVSAPEVATGRFGPDGYNDEIVLDVSHYQAEVEAIAAHAASGVGAMPPAGGSSLPEVAQDPEAPKPEEAKDPTAALNGAQVQSLLSIVQQVAARQIPRDTGVQLITAAFPLDVAAADRILGPVGSTFFVEVPSGQP